LQASGGGQYLFPASVLPTPLAVIAVDSAGHPVPDVPVTFTTPSGGGRLVVGAVEHDRVILSTDASGRAAVLWRSEDSDLPESAIVNAASAGLNAVEFVIHLVETEPADAGGFAAGSYNTCSVEAGGAATCWSPGWYRFPLEIGPASRITAGAGRFCARIATWSCWTEARPSEWSPDVRELEETAGEIEFTTLTMAWSHACGLTPGGIMHCWSDAAEEMARGFAAPGLPRVHPDLRFRQISAGEGFACGVTVERSIVCSGADGYGELGGPKSDFWHAIVAGGPYLQIAAGDNHACALRDTGTVICWGRNWEGQVGNAALSQRAGPGPIAALGSFRFVAAGPGRSCAVRDDGRVLCWGNRHEGEIPGENPGVPRIISGDFRFTELSIGRLHTCGRNAEGRVACWGEDFGGTLVEVEGVVLGS
jgi:hypothetical protein